MPLPIDLRALRTVLVDYQTPNFVRSVIEIAWTVGPLVFLWAIAWWAVSAGYWWLGLALSVPAAFFVVRLFAIQHDCGHRSFFRNARVNDWTGRVLGVITLTPHDCWRREHALHHATSGNLDRRGPGSVLTLTVNEYRALGPFQRLGYRLYRHPLVLFVVGPVFVFFFQQRWPVGLTREGWRPWVSAMGTNLALVLGVAVAVWLGGWQGLLLVTVPTMVIAASIGVWLFFVQHQFEDVRWERRDTWNHTEAALRGSSHYDLPHVLKWLTANIGVHHVHHVASRIPLYRLPVILKRFPHLQKMGRITLMQSMRCTRLALWDEASGRLISFRKMRSLEAQ